MAYINDEAYDACLDEIRTNATALYITSQEATTRTEAVTTYSLGTKASPTIAIPSDKAGGGREIVFAAITDGSVTADGTATHWAVVDGTRLLATGTLSSSQAVTNGNTFTLTSFAIGVVDAT